MKAAQLAAPNRAIEAETTPLRLFAFEPRCYEMQLRQGFPDFESSWSNTGTLFDMPARSDSNW